MDLRDALLGGPWQLIVKNVSSITLSVFQKELYGEEDGQSVREVHHDSIREALGEDNAGISGRAHAAPATGQVSAANRTDVHN
jgi:hypothetical protein